MGGDGSSLGVVGRVCGHEKTREKFASFSEELVELSLADALDFGAELEEFFVDMLVAAVDVVES